MSNNYSPLTSVTDGEVGKPGSSEDIGPASLPQAPINEETNQNSTSNYLVLQSMRENKKYFSIFLEKPNPKHLFKERIYSFILLGVFISDLLFHIIFEIKNSFGILGDVIDIIYLIILLYILFSSKIDFRKSWPKTFVTSMTSISCCIGMIGFGLDLLYFFTNNNFNRDIEKIILWFFIFILIIAIKILALFTIMILVESLDNKY